MFESNGGKSLLIATGKQDFSYLSKFYICITMILLSPSSITDIERSVIIGHMSEEELLDNFASYRKIRGLFYCVPKLDQKLNPQGQGGDC